jgi:hypothetical protein
MWSSMNPRTFAVGLGPLSGVPVTLTSTSGNFAQPCAAAKPQRAVVGATWTSRPSPLTPSSLPVETLTSLSLPPTSCTRQSAGGPGVPVAATESSSEVAGILASGPYSR